MQKRNIFFSLTLGIVILASGCTKKGDTGPAGATGATGQTGATGATGPSYTGAISGHVDLFDQYGGHVLTGLNAAQITLTGRAAINADATGAYQFDSVKTGDYVISASAPGYASTALVNFQYLADTLNKDVKMVAIPSFSFTSFTAYSNPTSPAPNDSLYLTYNPDTRAREIIIFVSNSSSVSNVIGNYLLVYSKAIGANSTKTNFLVYKQDLLDAGISSAQNVYYAVYSYVVNDVSAYEDFATGKIVYNAVNNPLTAMAVAP